MLLPPNTRAFIFEVALHGTAAYLFHDANYCPANALCPQREKVARIRRTRHAKPPALLRPRTVVQPL